MSDVFLEWQQHDIFLEDFQDETESFWNKLLPFEKYQFFAWATGFNHSGDVVKEHEYHCRFDELDENIQEEIVEKYAVQKGLVKDFPDDLPDWKSFDSEIIDRLLRR